jgi:hypothetical protein
VVADSRWMGGPGLAFPSPNGSPPPFFFTSHDRHNQPPKSAHYNICESCQCGFGTSTSARPTPFPNSSTRDVLFLILKRFFLIVHVHPIQNTSDIYGLQKLSYQLLHFTHFPTFLLLPNLLLYSPNLPLINQPNNKSICGIGMKMIFLLFFMNKLDGKANKL